MPLVPSEISKRTGYCVLLCSTDAHSSIWPDALTSTTFIRPMIAAAQLAVISKVEPGQITTVLSHFPPSPNRQHGFGLEQSFLTTIRPSFQAGRRARMTGEFGGCTSDPAIHRDLSPRHPRQCSLKHTNGCCTASEVRKEPDLQLFHCPENGRFS